MPDDRLAPDAAPRCTSGTIGGWDGTSSCKEGRRRWADAPSADMACAADADCVHVEAATCFHIAVRREAEAHYKEVTPCPNPGAGACVSLPMKAVCLGGCCQVRRGP